MLSKNIGSSFVSANKVRNKEDRPKRGGPQQFFKLLEKMDTNNDGQISASEVQGRLKENFSQIDADSNGFIKLMKFRRFLNEIYLHSRFSALYS